MQGDIYHLKIFYIVFLFCFGNIYLRYFVIFFVRTMLTTYSIYFTMSWSMFCNLQSASSYQFCGLSLKEHSQ